MKNILITGGLGFIGSHLVEHIYKTTDWNIIIIDKFSYSSKGIKRLQSAKIPINNKRVSLLTFDLTCKMERYLIEHIESFGDIHYIVHMAAETHVDNSIANPVEFCRNNHESTINILEIARNISSLEKFFYFSTDEVFGPALNDVLFKENDPYNPTNPYSASKAAGEMYSLAYKNTYNIPIIIINVMNAFGERQHVEKFIPKCIKMILNNEIVPIHSDKNGISGSRFYIHARNISDAVLFLIKNGKCGEKYNISGEREMSNLELAEFIARELKTHLRYELFDFHSTRPAHDLRYALDGRKLIKLGWTSPVDFEKSLRKTIRWTLNNQEWLEE